MGLNAGKGRNSQNLPGTRLRLRPLLLLPKSGFFQGKPRGKNWGEMGSCCPPLRWKKMKIKLEMGGKKIEKRLDGFGENGFNVGWKGLGLGKEPEVTWALPRGSLGRKRRFLGKSRSHAGVLKGISLPSPNFPWFYPKIHPRKQHQDRQELSFSSSSIWGKKLQKRLKVKP